MIFKWSEIAGKCPKRSKHGSNAIGNHFWTQNRWNFIANPDNERGKEKQ